MSGAAACALAAAAAVDEKAAAALTVSQVMQALLMQPADVLAEAKKEIDILGNIRALKEQQKHLRDERLKVGKHLRNEEKRRMRLRKRSRQLSDGDLVALLKMRTVGKTDSAPVAAEDPSAEAA